MIVIGLGAIIYSTKITDGAESSDIKSVVDGQDQMEQLRHKIEQFNEEITRKQEEKLEDTSEKMNTISNEKIMGISEYSDQVIDKIEKNHAEVVFLYDMLNEKQAEIQKLIHEADSSKVQFQDELAKSYQNVKDIVDPVEVSGKDAKKTGNEQSDSDLSEEDYDLQKLSDKERQAFDEEFSMQKEEKKVNHNEEILALHDKGYSILEISKMLEGTGRGQICIRYVRIALRAIMEEKQMKHKKTFWRGFGAGVPFRGSYFGHFVFAQNIGCAGGSSRKETWYGL